MKTAFIISTTVAVVLVLIIGASLVYAPVVSEQQTEKKAGGVNEATLFFNSATSTKVEVPSFGNLDASTTKMYRLMATTSRSWCSLTNIGPSTIHLAFDADAAPTYQGGVTITASSTFEIDADNLYTGSITGKAAGATSTLAIECY